MKGKISKNVLFLFATALIVAVFIIDFFGPNATTFVYGTSTTSTGSATVTATVPAQGGSGCDGCGSSGGGTVPSTEKVPISSVVVTPLSGTSVKIDWITSDTASDTRLNWGKYDTYESGFLKDPTLVFSHSLTISNLTPLTLYYIKLTSVSNAGTTATYPITYTTPEPTFTPIPITPFEITGLVTTPLSPTSYQMYWDTKNIPSDSRVDFGLTKQYEKGTVKSDEISLTHSESITNLISGASYFVKITSESTVSLPSGAKKKYVGTKEFILKAPASNFVPLKIVNVETIPQSTSIQLKWTTNKAGIGTAMYGLNGKILQSATMAGATTTPKILYTNLKPSTTYFFNIESHSQKEFNATDDESVSNENILATTLKAIGAPVISDASATPLSGTSVQFVWRTDELTSTKIQYNKNKDLVVSTTASTIQESVTTHEFRIDGLSSGGTYFYRVIAEGKNGTSYSEVLSFILPDVIPPQFLVSKVSSITPTSASITMVTDENVQGTASIWPIKTRDPVKTVAFTNFATDHTVGFQSLIPGVKYQANLYVVDASGNATNGSLTFITSGDSVPPVNVLRLSTQVIDAPPTLSEYHWNVVLNWRNSTDPDFSNVIVRYAFDAYPTSSITGYAFGNNFETSDTSIRNTFTFKKTESFPKRIFITVFSKDFSGNISSGALTEATFEISTLPTLPNADTDLDRVPDATDNCPLIYNPAQTDSNNNGIGDVCETETIPLASGDVDEDGVPDTADNCPTTRNSDQLDANQNGVGDVCDAPTTIPDEGGVKPKDVIEKNPLAPKESSPLDILKDLLGIGNEPSPAETGIVDGVKKFVVFHDLIFTTMANSIVLTPDGTRVTVLSGFDVGMFLRLSAIPKNKTVASTRVIVGNDSYAMNTIENGFATSFRSGIPDAPATLVVTYGDGSSDSIQFTVSNVGYGRITGSGFGSEGPLGGATVELLNNDGTLATTSKYGQINPMVTNTLGLFGYMMPNGRYRFRISREGYRTENSIPFDVTHNVINNSYNLIKLPTDVLAAIDPDASLMANIGNVAAALQQQLTFGAIIAGHETIKFKQNPEVQEATTYVVAPGAAGAIAVNTAVAAGPTFFTYLQFLFTQPAMLFNRRKRYGWGVVYNSLTKMPIDLAYVRLLDAATLRVVQTKITDLAGRYSFFAPKGKYVIEVVKQGFVYPTTYLKAAKDDGKFADVYHNEPIDITAESAELTPNVPVDPVGQNEAIAKKVLIQTIFKRIQFVFSISGMVVASLAVIEIANVTTVAMLMLHIGLYAMARKIAFPKKPKSWGIIYDATTKHPLRYAVARIFDKEYNKLLDTQISDGLGHYAFMASQRTYYVTYEKKGYEKKISSIFDLTAKKEPTIIGEKVSLAPLEAVVSH